MKKLILFLLLPLLASFALIPAFAQEPFIEVESVKPTNHTTLEKGKTVNKDYFAADEVVTVSGTVNGDAYLFGEKIVVDGTINGDLIVAGGKIEITGRVSDDVRAAGQDIKITGQIGKNVTAAGENIEIDKGRVSGSVLGAGKSFYLGSPVEREANIAAKELTVAGSIGRDLNFWGEDEPRLTQTASVSGSVHTHYTDWGKDPKKFLAGADRGVDLFLKILTLIVILVFGFILLKLMPVYTKRSVDVLSKHPFKSFLVGLLMLIAAPFIFILLIVTIVGIPFAILLIAGLFSFWLLAKVFVSLLIGMKIIEYLKTEVSPYAVLIVGVIVYLLVSSMPFVGGVISFILVVAGMGAVLLEEVGFYKTLRGKKLI